MKAGWEIRKLGDLCEIIGGGTPAKNVAEYYNGDIPWATVRDMKQFCLCNTEFKITPQGVKNSATNILPKGTIVISTHVGLGKICELMQDTAINQDLKGLFFNERVINKYFFSYWYRSKAQYIIDNGTGATVKGVKIPFIQSLEIPIPSLPEQQRIVDILDQEFAKIDALKANAEKSLQAAKDLFQATLKKELEPKDGWKVSSMGKVSSIARGGSPRPIKAFITEDADGINWIKIGDTEVGGKYISSTKERIRKEGMRSSRFVEAGDFLLSNSMSFGRPYILKTNGCIHDGWLVIKKYEDTFTQDFLYYLLLSPSVVKQFEEGARGSTVRNLNTDIVSAVRVSYPSTLQEQEEIVARVEEQNYKCKALQDNYQKTLSLCDDLKQALLRKAFNGEL